MLVSVDSDTGTVTLYGKTVITLPITQSKQLRTFLAGKNVQYVSEVTPASGDEILEMLAELAADPNIRVAPSAPTDGRLWLHATGSGYMNIPIAKMRFDGPEDFKEMSRLGLDILERHPILQELIDKKKLAIVTTEQRKHLLMIAAKRKEELEARMMMNFDGTKMIVDTVGGGKLKGRQMGDEFEVITGDQADSEFISDDVLRAMKEGWGRQETDEEAAEREDIEEGLL